MLFLLGVLLATTANAATIVNTNNNGTAVTRSASVTSASATIFKLDTSRDSVVEVSGTGAGTLKVSTAYDTTPSNYNGFVADPDGAASSNTGWRLPKGLSYVGLDVTSGTWTMRVAQPK